jgi:hypothetical protein
MKRSVYFIVFVFFGLNSSLLSGQQVISSAGASANGVGVQLSWTLGEPVIETFAVASAILTQGFHQTKLTVTAIDHPLFPELELSIYPNPVSSSLRLQVSGDQLQNLSYRLYNIEGKILISRKLEASPELINMELYNSGTYLLKVFRDENTPLHTFKVVKN